ncbi:MAG: LytTR family DNA-binding domain-containing protein [Bacteroidales bacterium]|nr:LytTR family DNA-binding domain-containing protein [Bacteroidales bacterium]
MKSFLRIPLYGSFGSMLILGLLQPFGIDQLGDRRIPFILGQVVIVFVGLIIAEYLCQRFIPQFTVQGIKENKECLSKWKIALRLAPSFVICPLILSAFLLSYCCWFNFGSVAYGWFEADGSFTLWPYAEMSMQVAMVSFFVYIWSIYSVSNDNLQDELSELRALNRLLEERMEAAEKMEEEHEELAQKPATPVLCRIEGNYHNDVLEVDPHNIVYVESMQNYADICYINEGTTQHKTLRITLKQLREALSDVECLAPCHRAFIVNLNFVTTISSRTSGGYQLSVFGTEKEIPVSRTYTEEIKMRLTKLS